MRNPEVELLYEVLIQRHRGSIKQVARVMRVAERTVYDYCTDGRLNPPAAVFRAGFQVTGDPDLKAVLEPEGWELQPRSLAQPATRDFEREIGDVGLALSGVLQEVRGALGNDGVIDKNELVAILRRLAEARHELDEVEALARQEGGKASLRVAGE